MAENTFVTAPIGGGKSLWGTIQICKALEQTDDFIVTNIPIILYLPKMAERLKTLADLISENKRRTRTDDEIYWTLQEYCEVFAKRQINVSERLVYLDAERSKEFFRYLPRGEIELTPEQLEQSGVEMWRFDDDPERISFGYKLPLIPHPQYGKVVDFTVRARPNPTKPTAGLLRRGCQYHMDEFHKLYPARSGVTDYMLEDYESELRKVDDNLTKYSQHPEKVLKNCRRNATRWIQVENMSKKRLLMGVTLGKRFHWQLYEQPEMPSKTDKPSETGTYFIDTGRRYEFLYRTLQGSSIAGGAPGVVSETQTRKGRHPIIWVLLLLGIVAGAYILPRAIQKGVAVSVGTVVGGVQKGVAEGVNGMVPTAPPDVRNFKDEQQKFPPRAAVPAAFQQAPIAPAIAPVGDSNLKCTGVMEWPKGNRTVFLTDGTTVDGEDVLDVGSHWVLVRGLGKIKRLPPPRN